MHATHPPPLSVPNALQELGAALRARRKALKVSATAAAEAAGMSRVTLHRIEKGEPSVTMGAYLQAASVLNLQIGILPPPAAAMAAGALSADPEGWLPVQIPIGNYPQLQRLAWQVNDQQTLTPREAWGIYQRNARHLDEGELAPQERQLIAALRAVLGDDGHGV